MIEVIEDIHALQHFRETSDVDCADTVSVIHLDNHQAWIESRLYWCLQAADKGNGMLTSCVLASYLCAYMLFTGVWASSFIPTHISVKLLPILQRVSNDVSWIGHENVLLWCMMVGGTFSQPGVMRSEYVMLRHQIGSPTFPPSWTEMETLLRSFIWSTKLFDSPGQAYWGACCLY